MISKKILSIISGAISIAVVVVGISGTYVLCSSNEKCVEILHLSFLNLLPIIPLFILSMAACFMRQEVYASWFAFVRIWIPLSLVAIFLAPEYSHDWMYRVEKGTVALAMSAIFVIVSLCIFVYGYMRQSRR